MDYGNQRHEVEYVRIEKAGEEVTFHGQLMSEVLLWIEFSCQQVLRLAHGEQVIMEGISNVVYIEPDEFSSYNKTREIIHEALRTWRICDCRRESLIERVIDDAQKFARSMSPGYSLLHLNVEVKVVYDQIRAEENNNYNMTPATDSSIKSLKLKIFFNESNDYDSCSICLDKFYKGFITTCMPCPHMFHSNCITKWLKTSHYCPVCRFEMPTRSTDA